ncbi:hypothetical protein ACGFYU_16215 [Streptomyces sp. NPDC048337]|uniref:hypothetical protein n=1 Tax=Streptomyces sp. NPDC048337 TaxID=3365535 RepID=UPI003723AEEE
MRKFLSVAGCFAAVAATGIAFAPAANAGGFGCSGALIDTYAVNLPISSQSPIHVSTINLYYDASTGRNCASNVKTSGGGLGQSTYMQVSIDRCVAGSTPGYRCTIDDDDYDGGYFKTYAGPVSVNASGRCISLFAETFTPNGEHGDVHRNATHCG